MTGEEGEIKEGDASVAASAEPDEKRDEERGKTRGGILPSRLSSGSLQMEPLSPRLCRGR